MTKRELVESSAFMRAKDDAQVWIHLPNRDELIPVKTWLIPFADGAQNLVIDVEEPEDPWKSARMAAMALNKMNLGIKFYGNLFPYLRKRGKLRGYCCPGYHGKKPVWLYDTEGIAWLVKNGELDYRPRD